MAKTDIFKPLTYQGTTYPSKEGYIADGNGVVQKRTYFRGSDGQYYAIDNNGNAVPMHLNNPNGGDAITLQYADSYQGDGSVVTPSEETWDYLRDRNQELQGDRDFTHFDIDENGKRMNLKNNIESHDLNVRRQALMRVAGYLRHYLLNPNEWRNVLYAPATPAEANFRENKGIVLKRDYYNKH